MILKPWKIQVGYSRILLLRITYVDVEWADSMRMSRAEFSTKHSWRPGVSQGRNEHNRKNQTMSGMILCVDYCLGLHKQLNSSRHRVHWLASKSDSYSQGEVQSQKLPNPMREISYCNSQNICICTFASFLFANFIHVGDCWKNMVF